MPRFTVTRGRFGRFDTVVLGDAATGRWAEFACRGATLLRWQVPFGGTGSDLVDGYATPAELEAQHGVRSGVMAPFPNRIAGGRYAFGGEAHDLLPGVAEAQRLIYHGFLRTMDCEVVAEEPGDEHARAVFASAAIRPGAFAGYPFALDLEIACTLDARGLALETVGRNVGERAAPYGCGWHPYFRLPGQGIAHLELTVPARTAILTDAALHPLPGQAAYAPLAAVPERDFCTGRALRGVALDACFAGLEPDADGIMRTVLRDPGSGLALSVWQTRGLMHVFTGDTLARDPRRTVALEPVELMTDAFNRADCIDAIVLRPGQARRFACGVEVLMG